MFNLSLGPIAPRIPLTDCPDQAIEAAKNLVLALKKDVLLSYKDTPCGLYHVDGDYTSYG